jgi:hypothetical protein
MTGGIAACGDRSGGAHRNHQFNSGSGLTAPVSMANFRFAHDRDTTTRFTIMLKSCLRSDLAMFQFTDPAFFGRRGCIRAECLERALILPEVKELGSRPFIVNPLPQLLAIVAFHTAPY